MPGTSGGSGGPRHAITDLYDEERRAFLVQYPVWVILALALGGVLAFGLSGFLGYPNTTFALDRAFLQPWALFLWFCLLMLTLQASIFRDVSLRRRLVMTLVVTVVAIVFIGITYFSNSLPDFIRRILSTHLLFRLLARQPWTYTVLNFGVLAVFWADTIRRWIRRARGMPPNPRVDIGLGESNPVFNSKDMPSLPELISGDLIAGALLTLVLSLIFRVEVVSLLVHTQPPLNTCQLRGHRHLHAKGWWPRRPANALLPGPDADAYLPPARPDSARAERHTQRPGCRGRCGRPDARSSITRGSERP